MTGITLSNSASTSLAAASSRVAEAASSAINRIKDGFLSCVRHVSNSMVTLRNALVNGLARLVDIFRPARTQTAENSPSLARKEEIKSVSLATTTAACQALEKRMQDDPANLNGMFRVSPELTPHQVNEYLSQPCNQLVEAINNNTLNCVEMGAVVKKWIERSIDGRIITDAERKEMVSDTSGHRTNDILTSKFQRNNNFEKDAYNTLLCCLSVMRTYQEVCDGKTAEGNQHYDRSVVDRIFIPSLFVINSDSTESVLKDVYASVPAMQALLKYCPPTEVPKVVSSAIVPLDNTGNHSGDQLDEISPHISLTTANENINFPPGTNMKNLADEQNRETDSEQRWADKLKLTTKSSQEWDRMGASIF